MSGRVRKYSEGLPQKIGPLKATLPITSILRWHGNSVGNCNLLPTTSPPRRHISPEFAISGHRSPGAILGGFKSNSEASGTGGLRRTASLDALYIAPPSFNSLLGMVSSVLHRDKATQTDESFIDTRIKGSNDMLKSESSSPDIKIEKVIRQRWQLSQHRGSENSVSSQTLSSAHGTASPVIVPQRTNSQSQLRPMRSSLEGLNEGLLNQEIEKLVLYTVKSSSRHGLGLVNFSRRTPEGHRAPVAEMFYSDMRSVDTQTPIGDILSSDDSHSTSPDEGASPMASASPRINRFLAREPPDGCEKICSKLNESDQSGSTTKLFKPCVGFQLRPSLGSAFQPLQPILSLNESTAALNVGDEACGFERASEEPQ